MRQVSGLALLTVLFVVTSGSACSSRPDEQIKVAEKAMEQAKEQRAEEFAQSDWANAQQVWEQAQSQLKNQRYGEAGTLLLRSKKFRRILRQENTRRREPPLRRRSGRSSKPRSNCRATWAQRKKPDPEKPRPRITRNRLAIRVLRNPTFPSRSTGRRKNLSNS